MQYELSAKTEDGFDFAPREPQKKIMQAITNGAKYLHVTMYRQSGKTTLGVQMLRDFLFFFDARQNPRAKVFMQTHENVKSVYFDRLNEYLKSLPASILTVRNSGSSGLTTVVVKRPWIGDKVTIEFAGYGSNVSARGGTVDFIILDELAFSTADFYFKVVRPMVAKTQGIVFVTSTVNSTNHYYTMGQTWKKLMEEGNTKYYYYDVNLYQDDFYDDKWKAETRKEYELAGKLHEFEQEYMNNYHAGPPGEYPFIESLRMHTEYITELKVIPKDTIINFVVDIGVYGNMATWGFIKERFNNKVTVLYYDDKFNGLDHLVDTLFNKFNNYAYINFIFPHDIGQPVYATSGSRGDMLRKHMQNKGMLKKAAIRELERPKSKEALINESVLLMKRGITFYAPETENGLDKLRNYRFKKDPKTGQILFGKFINNGCQHAADALYYLMATNTELYTESQDLLMSPVYNHGTYKIKKSYSERERLLRRKNSSLKRR